MPVNLSHYPFDYHTHFWGILPLRPKTGNPLATPSVERAVQQFYTAAGVAGFSALDVKRRIFALCIIKAQASLQGWVAIDRGYISDAAQVNTSFQEYLRGECFVENAIVARNMILPFKNMFNLFPETTVDALEASLVRLEQDTLSLTVNDLGSAEKRAAWVGGLTAQMTQQGVSANDIQTIVALAGDPGTELSDLSEACVALIPDIFYTSKFLKAPSSIYRYYDYFNDQMLAANTYTPFDDAYFGRDALKRLAPIVNGDDTFHLNAFLVQNTRDYYTENGITHTQISIGGPDSADPPAPGEDPIFDAMNANVGAADAWTPNHKLLYHNINHTVGTDPKLLKSFLDGAVRDFQRVDTPFYQRVIGIDFLGAESIIDFENLFSAIQNLTNTFAGMGGIWAHKRKFTLRIHCGEGSGTTPHNRSVLGSQIISTSVDNVFAKKSAYQDFVARLASFGNGTPVASSPYGWPNVVELMDKVFGGAYEDMRFNIFSEKTHNRISNIAETNMMSLFHAAIKTDDAGNLIYQQGQSAFDNIVIRLGHGHHARQFIHNLSAYPGLAYGFRNITFDTNLGSNFITGSSTEYGSIDEYESAKGIRTLTSYAPQKYVQHAIDATFGTSRVSDNLYGGNAFPLLIGSDGQGIEHTVLARENVRAFVLSVLRSALPADTMTGINLLNDDVLRDLIGLELTAGTVTSILSYARNYWNQNVGDPGDLVGAATIVNGTAWVMENRVDPVMSDGRDGFSYEKAPEFDIRWTPGAV